MQKPAFAFHKDPHSTHQPILSYVAKLGSGKILEFGAGYYSTPLLYEVVHEKKGRLLSFENDASFVSKFFGDNDMYFTIMDANWDTFFTSSICEEIQKMNWDVVFIDQAPWEARLVTVKHFANCCDYLLLHDCDYFIKTGQIKSWSEHFKYYKTYLPPEPWPFDTGPPTLVGSNKIEIHNIEIEGAFK